ncbi:hypothetical protein CEXT_591251 [Caerostris extrusa]|uniref:Ycf15 n=1 Tax=Caerostris extrusa TaxID=172846 RepID=A0AAV4MTC3_CAEEX|nr:hypothetical protein CEXT_591251 [Caerostris extrusa]
MNSPLNTHKHFILRCPLYSNSLPISPPSYFRWTLGIRQRRKRGEGSKSTGIDRLNTPSWGSLLKDSIFCISFVGEDFTGLLP